MRGGFGHFVSCTAARRIPREVRGSALFWHKVWAAVLTFLAYALLHQTRETLAKVKPDLQREWSGDGASSRQLFFGPDAGHATKEFLGTLDLVFMWCYAVGLLAGGSFGDRFSLRVVLGVAMMGSGVVTALFGVLGDGNLHSAAWYAAVWGLNGLMQSVCWPCVVSVMGQWWGKGVRGAAMGLWSGNVSVGNALAGPLTAAYVGRYGIGWDFAFMQSGAILFLGGALVAATLVPNPTSLGFPPVQINPTDGQDAQDGKEQGGEDDGERGGEDEEWLLGGERGEEGGGSGSSGSGGGEGVGGIGVGVGGSGDDDDDDDDDAVVGKGGTNAVGFLEALCLPGVVWFSLCYAFLKSVNYAMFFWLADYISAVLHWNAEESDLYSVLYDVGGIVGAFLSGASTDFVTRRSPVVFLSLLLSVPLLVVFGLPLHFSHAAMGTLSITLGICIGGAANLISSVFAVEIGEQALKKGKSSALATVAGLIDGIASIGAGAALFTISAIPWKDVSYLLAPLAFLSAVLLAPTVWKDVAAMRKIGILVPKTTTTKATTQTTASHEATSQTASIQ